eukprot:122929-Chlamydomonas_euryale.AAC.1
MRSQAAQTLPCVLCMLEMCHALTCVAHTVPTQASASDARARELSQSLARLRLERDELSAQLDAARAQAAADAAAVRAQMEAAADA